MSEFNFRVKRDAFSAIATAVIALVKQMGVEKKVAALFCILMFPWLLSAIKTLVLALPCSECLAALALPSGHYLPGNAQKRGHG